MIDCNHFETISNKIVPNIGNTKSIVLIMVKASAFQLQGYKFEPNPSLLYFDKLATGENNKVIPNPTKSLKGGNRTHIF